jgi:prepilin-type N-terminal cleavage/methylation domain-containing protein
MRARRGFTLWEMAIVLALTALATAMVLPNWTDFGATPPALPGDAVVTLLRDARRVAIEQMQTVSVRIDPSSLYFRVDTTGASGTGMFADGTLQMSSYESLETNLPRLQYVFRPTGAAIGDSVTIRGDMSVMVAVDSWNGEALRYAR